MAALPGPASLSARLTAIEAAVRERSSIVPRVGLVLGSGLGGLVEAIAAPAVIPFADVPGWPAATAPGHAGRLILGTLEGVPIACLQGRLHLYEGHSALQVAEPVLLMGRLGASTIVLTNAAGGVNPAFGPGTLVLIRDHLNLTGRTPLLGPNDDTIGPRFPDLSDAWSADLRRSLHAAADAEGIAVKEGVYACLIGPTYETPAEVRMLHLLGADAVGMSTVMEAIAAHWSGLRVCGISLVTNPGAGLSDRPLTHEEVLQAALEAGPRVSAILRRFVRQIGRPRRPDRSTVRSLGCAMRLDARGAPPGDNSSRRTL